MRLLLLLLGVYLNLYAPSYAQVVYIDNSSADVTLTFTISFPSIIEYKTSSNLSGGFNTMERRIWF